MRTSVVRLPDVAVAEHRESTRQARPCVQLQFTDRVPPRLPGVVLLRRCGHALRNRRATPSSAQTCAGADVQVSQSSKRPIRNLVVTGILYGVALFTAARTIERSNSGRAGTAAPPPWRVTLAAGHPKLMSMWSTRPPSQRMWTAFPMISDPSRRAAGCVVARRDRS